MLGLSVALAWVGWSGWVHRGHVVDDAYISLRYAANLLAGRGLVFNPGEAVEGVTNLGWVLVIATVGAVSPVSLPVVAKGSGLVFLVAAVVLGSLVHRRLVPSASPLERALLPVLVASSPELLYFALAGMETALAALLLVLGLRLLSGERPRVVAAGGIAGLLFAVRPESVVMYPLFATVLLASPGAANRRRAAAGLGLFLALVAGWTLFRLGSFGAALPNTYVAKGPGGAGELLRRAWGTLAGWHGNVAAPYVGSLVLVAGGVGVASLWHRRRAAAAYLAAAVGTGLLFVAYAPADWTGMGRYFGPYVPLAALAVLRGLFAGAARIPRLTPRAGAAVAGLLALAFTGVGVARAHRHLGLRALGEYPGFVLASESLVPAARWVGRELPPGTVVASRRIGALGYFGDRPVFDYAFGLTDARVARAAARAGEPFHSPAEAALADLWRGVRPGCILEDEEVTAPLAVGPRHREDVAVHGLRYRVVRRFPLGSAGEGRGPAALWVLACRPEVEGVSGGDGP